MKLIKAIIVSTRPNTWMRIWGEMIVAASLASHPHFNPLRFLLVFLATSPLLWSAAYMLNDLTDIKYDTKHPLRRLRPITSGILTKSMTTILIILLIIGAFLIGYSINFTVLILLILLFISQIFYTFPHLRFKEVFLLDLLLNILNSILRYLLGWSSQEAVHPLIISPILLFTLIKIAFFLGHRLQNRNLEKFYKFRTTVTVLSEKHIVFTIFTSVFLALLVNTFLIYKGVFPIRSLTGFIALIPLFYYLQKSRFGKIIEVEKDINFRNILYFSFFIWSNITAFTIITK